MFVFLSSGDSADLFPNNTPYDFTVALPETIELNGEYYCALVSYFQPVGEDVTIFSEILDYSYIADSYKPVLRQLNEIATHYEDFSNPQYMKVRVPRISEINIKIRQSTFFSHLVQLQEVQKQDWFSILKKYK